jgi:hypothetical protein
MPTSTSSQEPKQPVYKNPFVWAFVVGVVFLTVMPFLQRSFLKAPPPLHALGTFRVVLADGRTLTSEDLRGKVWVLQVLPSPCDTDCQARVERASHLVSHLVDVPGDGPLVTLSLDEARPPASTGVWLSPRPGNPRWLFVHPVSPGLSHLVAHGLLPAFLAFRATDAGFTARDLSRLPVLALVDQNGDVRGFWADDPAGRGNLVNAARLLAQYGPHP